MSWCLSQFIISGDGHIFSEPIQQYNELWKRNPIRLFHYLKNNVTSRDGRILFAQTFGKFEGLSLHQYLLNQDTEAVNIT